MSHSPRGMSHQPGETVVAIQHDYSAGHQQVILKHEAVLKSVTSSGKRCSAYREPPELKTANSKTPENRKEIGSETEQPKEFSGVFQNKTSLEI
ncbi:hypothetical protein AND_004149 [Anopheles darlingi]|uniref:Uncharacterized protein n=1 Tax=Anopheles darlingi TaxID=43151 RepID=W5JMX6_ANODA|nr:hypothetical protein AND_004149 [Anopheles darlingi]